MKPCISIYLIYNLFIYFLILAVDTLQITIALTSGVNFFHFSCAESTLLTMLTLMFNLYMFPQKSLISCLIITLVLVTLKYYTLIV